jgi:F-box-like
MSIPDPASGVKKARLSYWERPSQRQTRNSQEQLGSKRRASQIHISKCSKRRKIEPTCRLASLPVLPTEIWLLIFQEMAPKELQAVMQVNRLWYSEANKVLLVTITNLLKGKGLYAYSRYGLCSESVAFMEMYILPPTFEARKLVHFYPRYKGGTASGSVTVISLLEKEGLDGFPEEVWRNGPRFLRACLRSSDPGCQIYCWEMSKLCPGCNPEFIWPEGGNGPGIASCGGKLVHISEDGKIWFYNNRGVYTYTTDISDV